MNEPVTSTLAMRAKAGDGLTRMVVWSLAAHAVLLVAVMLAPRPSPPPPRMVMTVSLGGAPGPRAGGLTQIGGQAIPASPTPPAAAPRQAPPPPRATPRSAARETARPAAAPRTSVAAAPRTASSAASASAQPAAPEPQAGSTPTYTGARGQGFGLSGGGGAGRGVQLDVGNFCCPEYLEQMITLIQRNWQQNHGVVGSTVMKFTIARDGSLDAISVERSSRFVALDASAERALRLTQQIAPLPAAFPNPTLTVHMTFDYNR